MAAVRTDGLRGGGCAGFSGLPFGEFSGGEPFGQFGHRTGLLADKGALFAEMDFGVVAGGGVAHNQGRVWKHKEVGEGDAVAVGEEDDQIIALLDGLGDGLCGQWDECGVGALRQGD